MQEVNCGLSRWEVQRFQQGWNTSRPPRKGSLLHIKQNEVLIVVVPHTWQEAKVQCRKIILRGYIVRGR
jgi:hypothetical protein